MFYLFAALIVIGGWLVIWPHYYKVIYQVTMSLKMMILLRLKSKNIFTVTIFSGLLFVSSNPVHGEVYLIQHYVIKVCQWLATTGQWFSLGTLVSFTNKNVRHDMTEILLKVALNTINQNLILDYTLIHL